MRRGVVSFALLVIVGGAGSASAHHSFAAYFNDQIVEVTGRVTEFRFSNPHGMITLEVRGQDGGTEVWRAETNAPVILRRRGWAADSLRAGETIAVEGWPARDGGRYLRMRKVTRADGTVIGTPLSLNTASEGEKP
jgi:hypothetical protein